MLTRWSHPARGACFFRDQAAPRRARRMDAPCASWPSGFAHACGAASMCGPRPVEVPTGVVDQRRICPLPRAPAAPAPIACIGRTGSPGRAKPARNSARRRRISPHRPDHHFTRRPGNANAPPQMSLPLTLQGDALIFFEFVDGSSDFALSAVSVPPGERCGRSRYLLRTATLEPVAGIGMSIPFVPETFVR